MPPSQARATLSWHFYSLILEATQQVEERLHHGFAFEHSGRLVAVPQLDPSGDGLIGRVGQPAHRRRHRIGPGRSLQRMQITLLHAEGLELPLETGRSAEDREFLEMMAGFVDR